MKISFKVQIIILIVAVLVLSLEITVLILYEQGKLGLISYKIVNAFSRDDSFSENIQDAATERRIKELEQKIKDLEANQRVPFPGGRVTPPLTEEQISAIVQLWCPDDDYGYNGFMSLGSGSIINSEGLIITNRHVVSNYDWTVIESLPTCFVAVTEDISQPPILKYTANLIAYSPDTLDQYDFDFDVAVLQINDVCQECENAPDSLPSSFPFLDMGHSSVLSPGDYIAIAGYPGIGADTFTFTEGTVSGKVGEFVIKTDSKIDSGNSGGAALNSDKQLIGVPTWTISGQAESLGYVIGIDQVIQWYQQKVMSSDSKEVSY